MCRRGETKTKTKMWKWNKRLTEIAEEKRQAGTYWGATLLQYLSMPFLKYSTASHLTFTSSKWLLKIFCWGEKKYMNACFCYHKWLTIGNSRTDLMMCNSWNHKERSTSSKPLNCRIIKQMCWHEVKLYGAAPLKYRDTLTLNLKTPM